MTPLATPRVANSSSDKNVSNKFYFGTRWRKRAPVQDRDFLAWSETVWNLARDSRVYVDIYWSQTSKDSVENQRQCATNSICDRKQIASRIACLVVPILAMDGLDTLWEIMLEVSICISSRSTGPCQNVFFCTLLSLFLFKKLPKLT